MDMLLLVVVVLLSHSAAAAAANYCVCVRGILVVFFCCCCCLTTQHWDRFQSSSRLCVSTFEVWCWIRIYWRWNETRVRCGEPWQLLLLLLLLLLPSRCKRQLTHATNKQTNCRLRIVWATKRFCLRKHKLENGFFTLRSYKNKVHQ